MGLKRSMTVVLMATVVIAGCGGGDGDSADDAADTSPVETPSDATQSVSAAPDQPDDDDDDQPAAVDTGNGTITFSLSGFSDVSDEWQFVPVASAFSNGGWSMSFVPAHAEGGEALVLSLLPDNPAISLFDGAATTVGGKMECTFDIDHQDAGGASGTIDCTGMYSMSVDGSTGTSDLTATFDARA